MELYKMPFALIFLAAISLCLFHFIQAKDAPQDYLDAHNAARATVGVAPLTWVDQVAQFAQDYAKTHVGDCQLVLSGGGEKYGENLAMSTGDMSGTDVVNMWIGEMADYDYNSNTCDDGKVCGHYTQVIWRNSVNLGCAKVRCYSGEPLLDATIVPLGIGLGKNLIEIFRQI